MTHKLVNQMYPIPYLMSQYGLGRTASVEVRQAASDWLNTHMPGTPVPSMAGFVHGWIACHQDREKCWIVMADYEGFANDSVFPLNATGLTEAEAKSEAKMRTRVDHTAGNTNVLWFPSRDPMSILFGKDWNS